MDGLQFLTDDHHRIEKLFGQVVQASDPLNVTQLFVRLFQELSVHAVIEEQIFYPELAKYPETREFVPEVYSEHAEQKSEVAFLAALDPALPQWKEGLTKLRDAVLHHVREEEQEIFTKVRARLTPPQLDELGFRLQQASQASLQSPLVTIPIAEIQEIALMRHPEIPSTPKIPGMNLPGIEYLAAAETAAPLAHVDAAVGSASPQQVALGQAPTISPTADPTGAVTIMADGTTIADAHQQNS